METWMLLCLQGCCSLRMREASYRSEREITCQKSERSHSSLEQTRASVLRSPASWAHRASLSSPEYATRREGRQPCRNYAPKPSTPLPFTLTLPIRLPSMQQLFLSTGHTENWTF